MLWLLSPEFIIDLLLDQYAQMTDDDAKALTRRVAERVATREDRAKAWREENAQALAELERRHGEIL
ncbi:hypothetical protein FGK63_16790 [Ruegeria sediminis]|uniref:Addiction module protein n=1 Tax=Ruegeria sediminis TaxID=2583820 RepID=A0ABY2WVF9_9RHOB|nr:hypothetical protein [Ruegeria sediminis]TMV05696.1 hypothetical protein FGK63_16790 [Ruegeria sediminis]